MVEEDRKRKNTNPTDSKAIKGKIKNNQVKVKGKKTKREAKVEKRKITIHGREYWLTKAELPKELGCTVEEAEEIWKAAGKPEKPKTPPRWTDEQFLIALKAIGHPATSREVVDQLGIADKDYGRGLVRTRMAKLAGEGKVKATEAEKGRAAKLYSSA